MHVGRWRLQAVLVEDGFDLIRSAAKIPGKLHFLVADLRDLGDGAFEIVLHKVANGVELNSDGADLVLAGGK